MQEDTKKEAWKAAKVILFLAVSIFIILPYLVQVSTFFHEKAHMRNLDKYGVKNGYEANLFSTIPSFFNPKTEALGVTRFNFAEYLKLDRSKYGRSGFRFKAVNFSRSLFGLRECLSFLQSKNQKRI